MSTSTETFQHYQVLKNPDGSLCELGRGAMGVTYKAFDTSLRCNVALKVINTTYLSSEMAGQRFLREARAAAGLSHPNVASVFHLGQADGNYFYAMEYIDGETLESFVKRRGPLPPLTALRITLQVARALRAAARLGLVHRDIKPANLMLVREDDEDGGSDDDLHVKVIDFGLAKVMRSDGPDASGTITVAGFVGTPHFASPEQLEEKDLDTRSDIYSLGVTLWYMLAGRPPFSGSMVQVMSQHLTRRPPFERLPGIHPAALKVLERMLEKDSAGRPQSPTDLRREIEQAIAALAGSPADATTASRSEPDPLPTGTGPAAAGRSVSGPWPPGTILADRYQLMRQISRGERGSLFQATELDTLSTVAVRILASELAPDAAAFERVRRQFGELQTVSHPALVRLFALEQAEGHSFLVHEWVNGFPLLDVLRHRPVLGFEEVVCVLHPLAAAADTLKDAGNGGTELDPGGVLLSYEAAADPDTQTALLSSTLVEWPACQPKILPLRLTFETGSHATWTGQQTMVPSRDVLPPDATQLALLAYELLGGNVSHFRTTKRYSPLPTISEPGNDLLRERLLAGRNVDDQRAGEFVEALVAAGRPGGGGLNVPFHHRVAAAPAGPLLAPENDSSGTAHASPTEAPFPAAPSRVGAFPPPLPPGYTPRERRSPILIWVAVLLLGMGAAGYLTLRKYGTTPAGPVGNDTGASTLRQTGTPRPPATPRPIIAAQPTPPPVATPPLSPPLPTPEQTPPPGEPDRLAAALAKARALQDNRQTVAAFAAYVRIAEEFPASDEGLGRIDSYVSAMQADPLAAEAEQQRFQQFRASLERAAGIGSDLAMLFLADHLRSSEPGAAAEWYRRAVEKGRPEAMMALGDMYFSGAGVPLDPAQTSRWYQMASDKGYVKAKVKLAECYERGIGGVERNFDRAFRLLNEALGLEPDDARALEKLGLDYEAGHGTAPDFKRAFALVKRASDLGNTNATLVLGAYYMKGLGTPKDEKQGVALFKQGADKDNAAAMFYYAQCLRGGLGGLGANKAEAANYYRASAERGYVPAKNYCQENHIHFGP